MFAELLLLIDISAEVPRQSQAVLVGQAMESSLTLRPVWYPNGGRISDRGSSKEVMDINMPKCAKSKQRYL